MISNSGLAFAKFRKVITKPRACKKERNAELSKWRLTVKRIFQQVNVFAFSKPDMLISVAQRTIIQAKCIGNLYEEKQKDVFCDKHSEISKIMNCKFSNHRPYWITGGNVDKVHKKELTRKLDLFFKTALRNRCGKSHAGNLFTAKFFLAELFRPVSKV